MTPGPFDTIAPGAAVQLTAFLATVAGAALATGLAGGLLRWRRRRGVAAATDQAGEPPVRAVLVRRLLGVVLLLCLALPTAAVIRQLWPHPDLGARLIVVWLLILLLPVAAWLLTRVGDRSGRPRS